MPFFPEHLLVCVCFFRLYLGEFFFISSKLLAFLIQFGGHSSPPLCFLSLILQAESQINSDAHFTPAADIVVELFSSLWAISYRTFLEMCVY